MARLWSAASSAPVIALERAVALRRRWAYLAPLLSGLGGVALLVTRELPWPLWALGPALLTLGSLALVVVYIAVLRTQFTLFTGAMALGAAVLAAGDLLWLVWLPIYQTALWWAGFLVLTIVGERLELSRMAPRARAGRPLFLLAAGVYLLGIGLSASLQDVGTRVMGAGLVGLALWLARYDIARRTVRQRGLTRFIAAGLLTGYAWLLISGARMRSARAAVRLGRDRARPARRSPLTRAGRARHRVRRPGTSSEPRPAHAAHGVRERVSARRRVRGTPQQQRSRHARAPAPLSARARWPRLRRERTPPAHGATRGDPGRSLGSVASASAR